MLALNFGHWQFWETYDPEERTTGTEKVVFDGLTRTILVAEGVTEIDIGRDVYSAWKRWINANKEQENAAKWPLAITAVGGEPITDVQSLGTTFFLENGWRIQPFSTGDEYVLTINGNIYTREVGGNPVLFANGVSVSLTRSNLIDLITPESSLSNNDKTQIAQYVWDYLTNNNLVAGSYGQLVQQMDSDIGLVLTEVSDTLKKGEFIALQE